MSQIGAMREDNSSFQKKKNRIYSPHLSNSLRSICYVTHTFFNEMKENGFIPSSSSTNLTTNNVVNGYFIFLFYFFLFILFLFFCFFLFFYFFFILKIKGELLFQPKLSSNTSHCYPIHTLIYQSIASSPVELHAHLLSNITLSGGISSLPGKKK